MGRHQIADTLVYSMFSLLLVMLLFNIDLSLTLLVALSLVTTIYTLYSYNLYSSAVIFLVVISGIIVLFDPSTVKIDIISNHTVSSMLYYEDPIVMILSTLLLLTVLIYY